MTDAKSTCDTSDTQRGDNGSLTCHFDKNLRQNYTAFAVHRYNLTGALINPARVLDCFWKSTEDLKCTADDGYSFNETVTNKITVEIHEASDKHVGRYACLEVPPVPGEFSYCTFQPKEPPQVSSTQSADVSTAVLTFHTLYIFSLAAVVHYIPVPSLVCRHANSFSHTLTRKHAANMLSLASAL
ncbi:hypothetical protein BaRGS_00039389 [Batillaria attramentaria]|uniref:Uncharacterized protein n=1 Tax=Batillaria attramentaria TaxID=370345 RepID=A0ABD0J455_9CAEN